MGAAWSLKAPGCSASEATANTRGGSLAKVGEYRVRQWLGSGAYGDVYKVSKEGELFAMKVIDLAALMRKGALGVRKNAALEAIRNEIAVLQKVEHRNCIRLVEAIDDPLARKYFLVMELLHGGAILEHVPEDRPYLLEDDARAVFRELLLALEYLHGNGIVHRDIKPDNLVYAQQKEPASFTQQALFRSASAGVGALRKRSAWRKSEGAAMERRSAKTADAVDAAAQRQRTSFFTSWKRRSRTPPQGQRAPMADSREENPQAGRAKSVGAGRGGGGARAVERTWQLQQRSGQLGKARDGTGDAPLVKLLDFGVAQACPIHAGSEGRKGRVDDSVLKSGGTPAFFAPEMLTKGAYHGRPADVWAAGVSLCVMVSGKLPFEAESLPNLFEKIKKMEPRIPRGCVSKECEDLIAQMLVKEPMLRPTVAALRNHAWVTKHGTAPLPDQSDQLVAEVGDDSFGQGAGLHAAARVLSSASQFRTATLGASRSPPSRSKSAATWSIIGFHVGRRSSCKNKRESSDDSKPGSKTPSPNKKNSPGQSSCLDRKPRPWSPRKKQSPSPPKTASTPVAATQTSEAEPSESQLQAPAAGLLWA